MQHVPADKSRRDVRARGGSLKFYVSSGVYVDQTAIAALWAGFKAFPGLARFQRTLVDFLSWSVEDFCAGALDCNCELCAMPSMAMFNVHFSFPDRRHSI